jgi:hypothetical protein
MNQSLMYVPVLKWRQGEYRALKSLDEEVKESVVPLIEIPPIAWDFVEEQPQKNVPAHLESMPQSLADHWTGKCFVDFRFLVSEPVPTEELNENQGVDLAGQLLQFFDDLRLRQPAAIPVTGPSRDSAFQDAVREIANRGDTGVCVRLNLEDAFGEAALPAIGSVLSVAPELIDVVVDLQNVDPNQLALLRVVLKGFLGKLSKHGYRSVALVGSSFPRDLSEVSPGIGNITRSEWNLWSQMRGELGTSVAFGDYGISGVDVREIDPRIMVASASIRYTTDNEWLIFRGRSLRETRFGGYVQFRTLSTQVVNHAAYCGASFSRGDQYLFKCAHSLVGTGNLTTWRQVGTNHHITFVVRQLASRLEPSELRA